MHSHGAIALLDDKDLGCEVTGLCCLIRRELIDTRADQEDVCKVVELGLAGIRLFVDL
jgi:hypothetical protein